MNNGNKEIIVRPFNRRDQESARALILTGLEEHWGDLDDTKNPDLVDIELTYKTGFFLVAYEQNRLIGTGAFLPGKNNTVEIVRMSVSAEIRRRGVGREILDRLCAEARSRQYSRAILETCNSWYPAISFYLKYGFSITHKDGMDTYFCLTL